MRGALAVALAVVLWAASGVAHAQSTGMTAPVAGPLLARAASLDPAERMRAIEALQTLGTPAAWNLVIVMLEHDFDPRVRYAAAVALGASQDPDAEPHLAGAAVVDPDPAVRMEAATARAAVAPFGKRPKAAAGFSVLCPGCGYFYLGQTERAIAYLGAEAALIVSALAVIEHSPLVLQDDGSVAHDSGRAQPLLIAAQNLWFYGIFAAYRDARLARGDIGWRYPVAKEGLPELLLAPFNPRVLKRPWVWAGLPIMLGAAVGASYAISRVTSSDPDETRRTIFDPGGVKFFGHTYGAGAGFALGEAYNLTMFVPVGVGEEALFRGVIQAGLSETSLGKWGGWAVGSAIFGAVHTFNFIGDEGGVKTAAFAVPYLILTGSYLGYVFVKTDFSLATGTAIHFWYDFLLSTFDFMADPDHQPFVARFALPF